MKGYRFCLHKAYFDKGYAMTNYIKYLIAIFGISSLNVKITILLGILYFFFSYSFGRWWYKKNYILAENEVNNKFNLFQKEVRSKLKTEKFK